MLLVKFISSLLILSMPILLLAQEDSIPDIPLSDFTLVEYPPYLASCLDTMETRKENEYCSQEKLLQFVYKNIRYPEVAKKQGTSGTVIVSFVITKQGKIDTNSIQLLRDIGAECGKEALHITKRIAQELGPWVPKRYLGKIIPCTYSLPIRFKISNQ